jgi:predicted dienelactone hydrolase
MPLANLHYLRLLLAASAIVLCLVATHAQGAGFHFIEVPGDADGPALSGVMWYPCSERPGEVNVGRMTVPGVKDCPIIGDKLPLVVFSHGRGGNFVGHHDTAETLADAGFVVSAIDHPASTTSDMRRAGELSVLVERPTDIKRLIDFMVGASPAASKIDPNVSASLAFRWAVMRGSSPSALTLIGRSHYAGDRRRSQSASKSSGDSSWCGLSRMTRGSRPPSSPTRSAITLPRTASRP